MTCTVINNTTGMTEKDTIQRDLRKPNIIANEKQATVSTYIALSTDASGYVTITQLH